jgi:hypothetical protein
MAPTGARAAFVVSDWATKNKGGPRHLRRCRSAEREGHGVTNEREVRMLMTRGS